MARIRIKQIACSNCQYLFNKGENFCPNCGQENHHPNQPLRHYFAELIETLLHLDSKFFVTLKTLLTKPGQVSKEYNQNKRERYMPPVRLYVFVSFVFFLVLQYQPVIRVNTDEPDENEMIGTPLDSSNKNKHSDTKIDSSVAKEGALIFDSIQAQIDGQDVFENTGDTIPAKKKRKSLLNFNISQAQLEKMKEFNPAQIDSFILSEDGTPNFFTRRIIKQMIKWSEHHENLLDKFKSTILKFSSTSLFFLMPIFAFILYLLYWRSKRNYYEFLIFSIHFHILVFIVLSFLFIIQRLIPIPVLINFTLVFGIYIYLWMAMKNHFGQSHGKSFLKSFLAGVTYQFVVLITVIFIFLAGFLFT